MIWLLIVVLIMASAFFSGSETGLTGVSRAKIHQLKMDGSKRAAQVSLLRERKDRLIGAILLGNNAVNIAASALATSVAIAWFGQEGVWIVTIAMTLVVLIFAEVAPKTFAFYNSEKVALAVAPIFLVLVKVFAPITQAVQWCVNAAFRIVGIQVQQDNDMDATDILRGTIALQHDEGRVFKDDKDMLGSILDLNTVEVYEVMRHRKRMFTLNMDLPQPELIDKVLQSPHTRIPLWQEKPDNIVGVLHSKDLMRALHKQTAQETPLDIKGIMQTAWFVPQSRSLKDQLQAFREKQSHFALVVDEYGVLLGLITLEDIIEEIVGDIEDEYDRRRVKIRQMPDGSCLVDGTVTVRDLNRHLEWNLPDDDAATVAGLLIHDIQMIPDVGQVFHLHGYRFEVLRKQRNQIMGLRINRLTSEE